MHKIRNSYAYRIRIPIGNMCIVSSNGSWSSTLGFCRSYNFTNIFYHFYSLQYDSNNRRSHHSSHSIFEDLFTMSSNHSTDSFIMMKKKLFIWTNHFHANYMESRSFKTRDYFSSNTTTYTIRFQYYQSSLYVSHFYNNNKNIKTLAEYYRFVSNFQVILQKDTQYTMIVLILIS